MTKKLKIGKISLKNRLLLAPLVDVTDLAYRVICRRSGAGMAYTEMLNIGSILHKSRNAEDMMKTSKEDSPSGIQITGKNVKEFEDVISYIRKFDIVDINCGCPSSRTLDNMSGSYLLKTPGKIGEMISVLKDSGMTVTAKIRLGFKENNVIKIAKCIEKAGADALTVHARLSSNGRNVPADWKWIKKVKENIGIPVIGNGDIFSGKDAEKILEICDGAMIARRAIGNPMIFRNILYYLKTGEEKVSDPKEKLESFREYMILSKELNIAEVSRIKFIGSRFLKTFKGASSARNEFMKMKTYDQIRKFVDGLLDDE